MPVSTYGPTATGYQRPTLAELIQQEKDAMHAGQPSLTFAAGSRELGIVEMRATLRNEDWKARECEYNSFIYRNASGAALDDAVAILGYMRLIDETDAELIARVTNALSGEGFLSALETKLRELPGVEYVRVYNNTSGIIDAFTLNDTASFEVVIQGGDDLQIANVIWNCTSGVTNLGTTEVEFNDAQGVCRAVKFTRPTLTPQCLRIKLTAFDQACGCDGQNMTAIEDAILAALNEKGICGRNIGTPIYRSSISGRIYQTIKGIEITEIAFGPATEVLGVCNCDTTTYTVGTHSPAARELPTFDRDCLVIIATEV